VEAVTSKGATVVDGFIVADDRGLCPFKTSEGFCNNHESKPIGCKSSPFTFNDKGLLIVRNRYRSIRCYKCEGAAPAYDAHRWSLGQIFGAVEADRIAGEGKAGRAKIKALMPKRIADILVDNHNKRNGSELARLNPINRESEPMGIQPEWVCGDALDMLPTAPEADFVFSCPPYGDLEQYSDDLKDLSTMTLADFLETYRRIIALAVDRLKPDRFACFVVGDYRGKSGAYSNFVSETIGAFLDAGMTLHNEAILVTAVGSLCLQAANPFRKTRKLGKAHQNVLVFCKGNAAKATKACGPVDVYIEESEDENS